MMITNVPDIPVGFKKSEAGVIPKDWRVANLDECVRNDAPICYGILMPGQFHDGGVPVIKVKDIMKGRVDETDILLTDPTIESTYKRSRLRCGDLLITIRGTTGRVAIVPESLNGANITQDTARLRLNGNHLGKFLYFALQSRAAQDQIALHTVGQAVKGINIREIKEVVVPIPPVLAEQEAIAQALWDADALIESLEQLVAKKRHLKQAAMQQLLTGKKRLPGFNAQWATTALGDLARVQRGASPRPIDSPIWFDERSSIGWVRIADVTRAGMHLRETTQRLSPLGVENSRQVSRGNLIMSICATVGRPIITDIDVCIHDGFVVFDNLRADRYFVYYALQSIESDWSQHGQTGSQMNLNTELIRRTEISIPRNETEQTAIAEVLTDMDDDITSTGAKLAKACQIKQGMMQELLTGRTRLV